jgi:tRNA threonylcarbamoyladenosine biosynthesis protein TsaE
MMAHSALDETALQGIAGQLAAQCRVGDIFCLSGPLGAGKSTFARGFLRGLGLPEAAEVPSPTFTLVNSYAPPDVRLPALHIDLYRLETPREVAALGLEDMMEDHVLLVEWPERWGHDIPVRRTDILLSGSGAVRDLSVVQHI